MKTSTLKKRLLLQGNNAGFSLVEVLVVVAIIAVLAAMSTSGLSYLIRGNIKKAVKTMHSAIATSRTDSMSRSGKWELVISGGPSIGSDSQTDPYVVTNGYTDTTGIFVAEDEYQFDPMMTSIRLWDADGNLKGYLTNIQFEKSTGAVKSVTSTETTITRDSNPGYVDIEIIVNDNSRKIRLYYITGQMEYIYD